MPRDVALDHLEAHVGVEEQQPLAGRRLDAIAAYEAALPVLDEHEVESVAIGYLHAFVNPAHEQRSADWLARRRPDLSITLASEVCPEIREYERLSTACANAYVRPLMARYLERLSGELHELGFRCPFLLMTSGGGLTTLETAAKFPIRLVESGPAGGAILAQAVARQAGMSRVLSFDMGGTTAKLALVDDFEPLTSRSFEVDRVYRFRKGSGLPVRIPVIEMVEIGAGGGSIAWLDAGGMLQVGPQSAGADPGPACYGKGGDRPAVSDANVVVGHLPPKILGGEMVLDVGAAETAVKTVGDALGLDVVHYAYFIGGPKWILIHSHVLLGHLVDVCVGSVVADLGDSSADHQRAVRVFGVDDRDRHARIPSYVSILQSTLGRVHDDERSVGIDPDGTRLRAAVFHQRR